MGRQHNLNASMHHNLTAVWTFIWAYHLATSGLLLHSTTMSQKRMGQRPTDMLCMNMGLKVTAMSQQTRVNRIWIRADCTMNLKARFTVPSIFSWLMAVGMYERRLKSIWRSCICTNEPVKTLQTRIMGNQSFLEQSIPWSSYIVYAGIDTRNLGTAMVMNEMR